MLKSFIIAGVGGQGTLLTSKIISTAALSKNLFVRTSETIGMAQRGGSVSSHVRIGARDVSPVVPFAHADVLLGFEPSEAVRQICRLKDGAGAVVNTDAIIPTNVTLGQGKYFHDEYLELLREKMPNGLFISALPFAAAVGDPRTLNIIMLGAASGAGLLPFTADELLETMRLCIKPSLIKINERAFELGLKAADK